MQELEFGSGRHQTQNPSLFREVNSTGTNIQGLTLTHLYYISVQIYNQG